MSSLFPMMQSVAGDGVLVSGIIAEALVWGGIPVTAKAFLWVFTILFAVRIITQLVGQSLSTFLGRRVMAQLGSRAFEKIIQTLDIREINEKSMGYYIGLAGDESFRASTLIMAMTQFFSVAALALLYFAAIARFSPATAFGIMLFALCSLFALYKVTKLSHRLGSKQTEQSRNAGSVFLDSLNNLKTVRAFSAEGYVAGLYRNMIFEYANTLFRIDALTLLTKLLPILLLLLIFIVALALSSQTIESGNLAFIVTMFAYLSRFFPTVGQGVTLLIKIASDAKSGKDVTAILYSRQSLSGGINKKVKKIDEISLRDLCFSYDKGNDKKILRGVNFKFKRERSYAIAGESGVGKSTLVDLMLKFYLPTSGYVFINHESIAAVEDSDLRKQIILVGQEAAIFDDSVNNNIRLGMEASIADIQSACKSALIHDVIGAMSDGYNTRLQYQGKNLSGGQRQRIAIARALLRKPDVLIFDESTSALDKVTQTQVIENILRDYAHKIVIFITHDPDIMRRVDEVIDLGKINDRLNHRSF